MKRGPTLSHEMMTQQVLFFVLTSYLVSTTSGYITNHTNLVDQQCPTRCLCNQEVVDCSYLGLEEIPNVPVKTKVLILTGNKIKRIADMDRLGNIEALYLHGNKITDVTTLLAASFLKILDVSNNPIGCDCKLQMTLDSLSKQNIQLVNLDSTKCAFPRRLYGQSLSDLMMGVNVCNKHRQQRDDSEEDSRHGGAICEGNPCKHGGTCVMRPHHTWQCVCQPEYQGKYCEWRTGDMLSMTVTDVTSCDIEVRWSIDAEDIMDFRLVYMEDYIEFNPQETKVSLNGSSRWYRIEQLKPDTTYTICLAAFSYTSRKRSPGNIIEEVCLLQKTDPSQTTQHSRPNRPLTDSAMPVPSLDGATDDKLDLQTIMTIFGVILCICLVLICVVAILYVIRLRGITLTRRGRHRRHSPPNVINVENPTYGSTSSPTPSVQDIPIGESGNGIVTQDNDVPLILETSGNIVGVHTCSNQDVLDESTTNASLTATLQDNTLKTIQDPQDTLRIQIIDEELSHHENMQHSVNDMNELDNPEQQVIQC
ncbi:vasorin-like [Asterias amurensis]|uniref:vasorin-like n=1 Tax=Asterias amurensis TaxID=7602 RepID=UPI003AB8CD02